jgi:hypothetical protein
MAPWLAAPASASMSTLPCSSVSQGETDTTSGSTCSTYQRSRCLDTGHPPRKGQTVLADRRQSHPRKIHRHLAPTGLAARRVARREPPAAAIGWLHGSACRGSCDACSGMGRQAMRSLASACVCGSRAKPVQPEQRSENCPISQARTVLHQTFREMSVARPCGIQCPGQTRMIVYSGSYLRQSLRHFSASP